MKQFCWSDLKIWTASIITSWNFLKNKAVLMISHEVWPTAIITRWNFCKNKGILFMWLENLACPYYCEVLLKWFEKLNYPYYQALKFSRKQGSFVKAIRKFELRLWWRAEMFSKIRQFWWYHLKIWTASIITRLNFCENVPYLMKSFEHLNCHEVYHEA